MNAEPRSPHREDVVTAIRPRFGSAWRRTAGVRRLAGVFLTPLLWIAAAVGGLLAWAGDRRDGPDGWLWQAYAAESRVSPPDRGVEVRGGWKLPPVPAAAGRPEWETTRVPLPEAVGSLEWIRHWSPDWTAPPPRPFLGGVSVEGRVRWWVVPAAVGPFCLFALVWAAWRGDRADGEPRPERRRSAAAWGLVRPAVRTLILTLAAFAAACVFLPYRPTGPGLGRLVVAVAQDTDLEGAIDPPGGLVMRWDRLGADDMRGKTREEELRRLGRDWTWGNPGPGFGLSPPTFSLRRHADLSSHGHGLHIRTTWSVTAPRWAPLIPAGAALIGTVLLAAVRRVRHATTT